MVAPTSAAGIERYLGSGLVPGVGKEIASRLVGKFGAETLHVIDAEPVRLREVEGIGKVRAEQIQAAWRKQKDIREVMIFLQSCGVSTILAARIYGLYGGNAAARIRSNPWRLARIADAPSVRSRRGTGPDACRVWHGRHINSSGRSGLRQPRQLLVVAPAAVRAITEDNSSALTARGRNKM